MLVASIVLLASIFAQLIVVTVADAIMYNFNAYLLIGWITQILYWIFSFSVAIYAGVSAAEDK